MYVAVEEDPKAREVEFLRRIAMGTMLLYGTVAGMRSEEPRSRSIAAPTE